MSESNLFSEVVSACKRVHSELGGGFRELSYQRALEKELECHDHVTVERERTIPLFYTTSKGCKVHIGDGRADLVVKRQVYHLLVSLV